jgi:DNA polymerase I-like protein with 3'-5' exonuclease and polymerase domains
MRCSINVTGAKTLRFSTSLNAFGTGTNLQNLPKGTKIAQHVKELGPQSISELEKCGFKLADIDAEEDSGAIQVVGKIVYPRLVFPNVRSFFIPDPDHIIMEWDLERADLQVVVWEADDSVLKQILREGVDLHAENAKVLGCSRQMAKTFVHGTNYGGTARTMAKNCGVLVHQSELMQRRWFGAHPGIKTWHRRTEMQLATNRTITNRFGFRITFFDRMESLLPKALAWTPQSTVALAINIGLVEVAKHLPEVEFLLQVHDSLLLQVHKSHFPAIIPSIRKHIQVTIPYPDPLVIPTSCSWSDRSWGDAEPYKALHT